MPGTSARAANTWLMTCTRQLTSQSASDARLLSLARQAGIGEEHVDRPVFVFCRRDQRLDVFFQPDVGGDREAVDVAGDVGQPFTRGLEIGNHDAAGAGLRLGARHRFADPARAPGDDADLAFDVHVFASRFCVVVVSANVQP